MIRVRMVDGRLAAVLVLSHLACLGLAHGSEPKPRAAFSAYQNPVHDLDFSPDGKSLASAGEGQEDIIIWDVATGNRKARFAPRLSEHYWCCIAFSPDGRTLAIGGTNLKSFRPDDDKLPICTIRLWNVVSGDDDVVVIARDRPTMVGALRYSPDGRTLAVNKATELYLWDSPAGRVRAKLEIIPVVRGRRATMQDYMACFRGNCFSTDSALLATGGDRARLWNVSTGETRAVCWGQRDVMSVAISPDCKTLVSVSLEKTLCLWTVPDEMPDEVMIKPRVLLRFPDKLRAVSYLPDGKHLALANESGAITLHEATTGRQAVILGNHPKLYCMAVSPAGNLIATGGLDGSIRLWDVPRPLKQPGEGRPPKQ